MHTSCCVLWHAAPPHSFVLIWSLVQSAELPWSRKAAARTRHDRPELCCMSARLAGREAYRGVGQLEDPPTDASFFTRRHINYPPFTSARPPKELRGGHSAGVRALAWNATGDVLMSCGSDQLVRAWHPEKSTRCAPRQNSLDILGRSQR